MTWYKRPAVWAVALSLIAIILSQLPKISNWIPRADLNVEFGSTVGLPTDVGIPGYQLFVNLENSGNRKLNLSDFKLDLVLPNGDHKQLDATSYSGAGDNQWYTPTTIQLKPEDRWGMNLAFYPKMTPTQEEQVGRIKSEIDYSISTKRRALRPTEYTPEVIVEADSSFVADALAFFNREFNLETGSYKASLSCNQNGSLVTLKAFEFSLYDYHIKTLKSQTADYKFGWGVNAPATGTKQVWVQISKTN